MCGHIVNHNNLLMIFLTFSDISCSVFFKSSLYFFLVRLAKSLSVFKGPALCFLDLIYYSFSLYLIYIFHDHYYFFLLLTLGLIYFCFDISCDSLSEIFYFFDVGIDLYRFSSYYFFAMLHMCWYILSSFLFI